MDKSPKLRHVRNLWFLLGCGIACLASSVCLAIPTGGWARNGEDQATPQGTKVCAEWEGADLDVNFCYISPQALGTDDWNACQDAFRHTH